VKVSLEDKEIVIRIPEGVLSVEYIQDLIERFELEEFVKDVKMSEEDAWTLSEKIKEEWWAKEGKKLLREKGIS